MYHFERRCGKSLGSIGVGWKNQVGRLQGKVSVLSAELGLGLWSSFPGSDCLEPSHSVIFLFISSLSSVDLQQQIMTIVDELGKASAKVLGSL